MSNVLKYIKDLEAAGFQRNQAEVQVQMVIDALEGGLVTKNDFSVFKNDFAIFKSEMNVFKEHVDNRFDRFQHDIDNRFVQTETRIQNQMDLRFTQVHSQIQESEFRTVTRLGMLVVSTTSLAVALMAWLIKV